MPDLTTLDVHNPLHVVADGLSVHLLTHLSELGSQFILSNGSLSNIVVVATILINIDRLLVAVSLASLLAKLLDNLHDLETRQI